MTRKESFCPAQLTTGSLEKPYACMIPKDYNYTKTSTLPLVLDDKGLLKAYVGRADGSRPSGLEKNLWRSDSELGEVTIKSVEIIDATYEDKTKVEKSLKDVKGFITVADNDTPETNQHDVRVEVQYTTSRTYAFERGITIGVSGNPIC